MEDVPIPVNRQVFMKSVRAPCEYLVSQWFGHQAMLQRSAWVGLERVSSLRGGSAVMILPFALSCILCLWMTLVSLKAGSSQSKALILMCWCFLMRTSFVHLEPDQLLQFITGSDRSLTAKQTGEMQKLLMYLTLHTLTYWSELDLVAFRKYHYLQSWTCSFLMLFSKLS